MNFISHVRSPGDAEEAYADLKHLVAHGGCGEHRDSEKAQPLKLECDSGAKLGLR